MGAAADLARRQWTQFGVASMGGGLAVLAATLAAQLAACWAVVQPPPLRPPDLVAAAALATRQAAGSREDLDRRAVPLGGVAPQAAWQRGVEGAAWLAVLGHGAALFSNSFILAQVQSAPVTSSVHIVHC